MDTHLVTDEYVQQVAARRWGISMQKTGRQHWNSPCPICGGTDRFYVTEHGHFQCNQCDYSGFLDDDQADYRPEPEQLLQAAEQRKREAEMRQQRWVDWQNGFLAGYYWRQWHDQMTEANRAWWREQGISDFQIDYYELGYLPQKSITTAAGTLVLPAYTIPVRNTEWKMVNIHYRLVQPPAGVQKYRYESGIPSHEFYATPGKGGSAIVVEGAKKAMVTYDRIDAACQVIGLPGCSPSEEIIQRIHRDFETLWLCLDPGCERQEQRFKRLAPQSRIVRLPGKPDDLFLAGMDKAQFREYLRQAR